jgi:hypothetical protein
MTTRFRPTLDLLEAREVPAALSYQLSGGGQIGSGLFTTPDGVDPAQSWQSLPLTDLTVTQGGVTYAVQPGATADYESGTLVGVTATATSGSDTLQFADGTVYMNGQDYAQVVYDPADTMQTFTLSDGTVGAISYQVPWDQVDPTQASQSLTPTINLNIAGQNFTYGSANYTSGPTLLFQSGDLAGVNFAVATAGTPYLNVSAANGIAAAEIAVNQYLYAPVANKGPGSIVADFKNFKPPTAAQGDQEVSLLVKLSDSTDVRIQISVTSNTTKTGLRDLFVTALQSHNIKASASGDTQLIITGKVGQEITSIQFFQFTWDTGIEPVKGGASKNSNGTYPGWVNPA